MIYLFKIVVTLILSCTCVLAVYAKDPIRIIDGTVTKVKLPVTMLVKQACSAAL